VSTALNCRNKTNGQIHCSSTEWVDMNCIHVCHREAEIYTESSSYNCITAGLLAITTIYDTTG